MNDEARDLEELRARIDDAQGQLARAHAQLAAATTSSHGMADAIRLALEDIVALGKRIAELHQTLNDQIAALAPPLRCARCRAQLAPMARRCVRCSAPLAQA
jgi:septal ring factor EnvC (AmiA/AmiB activator)